MRIKLSKSQWEQIGKEAGWASALKRPKYKSDADGVYVENPDDEVGFIMPERDKKRKQEKKKKEEEK
jgi:hypothetical protein